MSPFRSRTLLSFFKKENGNVAIIFALSIIPILFAVAFAVDYGTAARVRTQLQAVADAAALAAITPTMMSQSSTTAQAAATSMFGGQAALINSFVYNSANLTITVTDTVTATTVRKVSVTYAAQVKNAFGALYNQAQISFTVSSTGSATTAPNIDFYLLLDNSPSMELPATTSGLATMTALGCAFACHETNYKDSDYTTHYPGWGTTDSYTYAENNGIALRIDNVRAAAASLASNAQATMASNSASYRMAAYGFNFGVTLLQALTTTSSANVSAITANINTLTPPIMSSNGYLAGGQTYTYPTGSSTYQSVTLGSAALSNDDAMTDFDMAMTKMASIVPNPGNGTNATGDSPQKVLMIVTDGVMDANFVSSSSCNTSYYWAYTNTYGTFYRCLQPIDTSFCTTIKNRGIKIAVLYTTYYPVTSNSFYNAYVAPFISQVATNLQSCASSSSLFFQVDTGGDVTSAMQTLFVNAVYSASHITQ